MMRNKWFAPALVALMFAVGALVYPLLPDRVPSHWNAAGEIDGYTNRLTGALLLPGIALAVWLVFRALPALDPRRANYAQFAGTYRLFMNVVVLFLAALYALTLAIGVGWNVPAARVIVIGVGLLLAVMGNEMGRVQPNFFVGVRTPWTLADPEVWRRTHRVVGRAMVLTGLVDIVAALSLPQAWLFGVVLAGALGIGILSIWYSYAVWRRRINV